MDLITQLPTTKKGNDTIIVFVDKFSKMVHYAATTTTCTAEDVAKIFFDTIVRLHGIPKNIVSDRDTRFTSRFWRRLWKLCGTNLKLSTAWHPQTDGQTERANRVLEDVLRNYVSTKQDDWDEHLTAAEIAVNSSIQATTKFSPYQLNYGEKPIMPAQIQAGEERNECVAELMSNLHRDVEQARQNMEEARDRQAHYANKTRRDFVFKEGEEVLLSTKNLKRPKGLTAKLGNRFTGPFRIKQEVSPVAYKLELPDKWRIHDVFHISLLRKFRKGDEQGTDIEIIDLDEAEEQEYEVDKVIGKRYGKSHQLEYLVLWKDYPESEATWEPYENLKDVAALDDFENGSHVQVTDHRDPGRITQVWRKWKKAKVLEWLETLPEPPEPDLSVKQVKDTFSKQKIDGERLTELTQDVIQEMGFSPTGARWIQDHCDQLFHPECTYKL
jgi:hypothetical protein